MLVCLMRKLAYSIFLLVNGWNWFVEICIAPVKTRSCYKGEGSDECDVGRLHQALDGEA